MLIQLCLKYLVIAPGLCVHGHSHILPFSDPISGRLPRLTALYVTMSIEVTAPSARPAYKSDRYAQAQSNGNMNSASCFGPHALYSSMYIVSTVAHFHLSASPKKSSPQTPSSIVTKPITPPSFQRPGLRASKHCACAETARVEGWKGKLHVPAHQSPSASSR